MRLRCGPAHIIAVCALISSGAISQTTTGPQGGGNAADLLHRVVAKYRSLSSIQADIETVVAFGDTKQRSIGSVKAKKPSFVRLETAGPQGMLLVADGKSTYMYIKAANQYMKFPGSAVSGAAQGASSGNFGLTLFLDPSVLYSDTSKAVYAGKEKVDGIDCDVVSLSESGEDGKGITYKIYVQPNLLVRRTTFEMPIQGSSGTMQSTLRNIVVDQPVATSLFRFTPPRMAKLMQMPSAESYDAKLLKVGTSAPAFTIPTPGGRQLALADARRGKRAVIVNFWFYG